MYYMWEVVLLTSVITFGVHWLRYNFYLKLQASKLKSRFKTILTWLLVGFDNVVLSAFWAFVLTWGMDWVSDATLNAAFSHVWDQYQIRQSLTIFILAMILDVLWVLVLDPLLTKWTMMLEHDSINENEKESSKK